MIVCLVYELDNWNNYNIVENKVFCLEDNKIYTKADLTPKHWYNKKLKITYSSSVFYDITNRMVVNIDRKLEEEWGRNSIKSNIAKAISDPAYKALLSQTTEEALSQQEYDQWLNKKFWKNK